MQWISVELHLNRGDLCAKLTKKYPTLSAARWVASGRESCETLELFCGEPIVMRHVVGDLLAMQGKRELELLAKKTPYHDVVIVVVKLYQYRTGGRGPEDSSPEKKDLRTTSPLEVITNHASLLYMPILYEKGNARFKLIAVAEPEIPDMLRQLGHFGKLSILARIQVDDIPVEESLMLSTSELFSKITYKQAAAFLSAARLGYFRVPRKTKFAELSGVTGVPRTTFETHVRKAESKILAALTPYMAVHFKAAPSGSLTGEPFGAPTSPRHKPSGHLTAKHYYRRAKITESVESKVISEELFRAIKEGKVQEVRLMLERNGTLANARNSQGMSAVTVATYYRQSEIGNVLIAKGAKLDLFEASMTGKIDIVRDLISRKQIGADAYSSDGFSALHLAAFFGNPEVAEYLVSNGADVNQVARNLTKVMPLHSAVAHGQVEIAKMLLKHGANVNARQEGGFTPLHAAAFGGNLRMAKLLLEHGADREMRTDKGKSAFDLTDEDSPEAGPKKGRLRVARLLRNN